MTHIYAFGSVCRGEVTPESDIDLLAITQGIDRRFDPDQYSVYSYNRIAEIWKEGNAFAWHLSIEARLLHSSDALDHLRELGEPAPYKSTTQDCLKFFDLFGRSSNSLRSGTNSPIFELSTIFLAARNFATCYSLGAGSPDFSRHSALRLEGNGLPIPSEIFDILERARLICTRGTGEIITREEAASAIQKLAEIENWMRNLLESVN